MRLLTLAAVLLWAVSAHAGGDCAAEFSDCREDCTLMYGGSVKVSNKKKFSKCASKCTKKKNTCEERAFETKRNSLEAGSLDKSPTSRDVDESGLPTRTAVSKGDDDAPVSTRTKLDKVQEPVKADDDDARPPPRDEPKAERPVPVREERPAPRDEPKVHPTEKKDPGEDLRDDGDRRDDDEELRDDGPRRDKKRDKKRDPPKEEDHDDLRYY